ncbi:MAG: hypothetical protein Q9174_001534 [Haloplaca sp. 1 TL-2023]
MMQSAVRLPTPPPLDHYPSYPTLSRKRSPPSRSPSPVRRRSPPRRVEYSGQAVKDGDPQRAVERERQLAERLRKHEPEPTKPPTEEEKQAAAKAEYEKLLNSRSGGTYIPPARLRALQAQITDKTSKEYQRMAWEALKKSINGLINKVNVSNIKHIVPELFTENLVRGRGLFCRSIMKAAASSSAFVSIYATMAAIINTKLPQVGELLIHRLIVQFKKAFKRNDKAVCLSSTMFIAHLVNRQVVHEILAAQILLLLLNKPTDDSVEIAVGLMREVGQHLEEMSGPIALAVFDQFRSILHEQDIDKRVQYMIEVLFQVRKDKYKDNPAIKEELDLVEEEDQITHRASLDDDVDVQDKLNVFKFDEEWEEHEEAYRKLKAEILGEAEGSDDEECDSGESSDDEEAKEEKELEIKDQTNTDLTNLRRTIYLTIMSSLDFEEAVHKLLKVNLPVGQETELPSMIVECCSQERTYSKFYGLIGERFAKLNRLWTDLFERSFATYYDTIHRYETNRLRNIARFFGHLLSSDAVGWHVLSIVHLNEEETTSSSRIFIKILFQDLAEALGMPKLQARFKDDLLRTNFDGVFPTENARDTRFSINYFTSIGMGALTEGMREHLKNAPKPMAIMPAKAESDSESGSSVSSYSSYNRTRAQGRHHLRGASSVAGQDPTPDRPHLHQGHALVDGGPIRALLSLQLPGMVAADHAVLHHKGVMVDSRAVLGQLEGCDEIQAAHIRARVLGRERMALAVGETGHLPGQYLEIGGDDINIGRMDLPNSLNTISNRANAFYSIDEGYLQLWSEFDSRRPQDSRASLNFRKRNVVDLVKDNKTSKSSQPAPSSHHPNSDSHQEGRTGGHKSKKKHDRATDRASKEKISDPFPKELTSSPYSLSQPKRPFSPLLDTSEDVSSPLIEALGELPKTEQSGQPLQRGLGSTGAVSPYGSPPNSCGNGISINGSPPGPRLPAGRFSGGFGANVSPGRSPPMVHSKPIRQPSAYQSFGGYHGSPPAADRLKSKPLHRSPGHNPALPHYPQAHFHSAPELDFGLPPEYRNDGKSMDRGCRVFDNLDAAGGEGFRGAESALLVGSRTRLDVFSVAKDRLDLIGRLENLRGKVVNAKLLSSPPRDDPLRALRPLVVVAICGPQSTDQLAFSPDARNDSDEALFDPSASTMQALDQTDNFIQSSATSYQTTIEVYSLQKSTHVATLLRGPKLDSMPSHGNPCLTESPSDEEWRLQATGRFLVAGSGKSGEIFIFECIQNSSVATSAAFRCIGKTWTSLSQKRKRSLSTSSTESDLEDRSGPGSSQRNGAIFDLSHRWIAIAPPNANMRTTTHASVDLKQSQQRPPGLLSHTSPPSPQPTCELDTPEQESLLNKVARDVTQEFLKGARWIGDQGMQAWKQYWQKPPDLNDVTASGAPNSGAPSSVPSPLPPTHAHDGGSSRAAEQGALVSVLDLEKLSLGQTLKEDVALQPIATFALPDGCSLVSFTPTGLGLLTASAKGDVQRVWSLMRMAHGGGAMGDHGYALKAPSIRQIARFTRLTVASIADVVWTDPSGERLALVTERGTVHIYDLPASALQWPPPRRIIKSSAVITPSPNASPELAPVPSQRSGSSRFSSAMDMVAGRSQPLLAAVRGRPASIGNPFSGFGGMSLTAGAGITSGKVVAAGFNRSIGAATGTVSSIRHLGENRLTLPGSPLAVVPGCVQWLAGRDQGYMAVTGGAIVRIHRIRQSTNQKPGKRRPSAFGSKPNEMNLIDATESPMRNKRDNRPQGDELAASSPLGFWHGPIRPRSAHHTEEMNIHSQAEIETNAPYQPFHTDRRINLHNYSTDDASDPHHLSDSTPWAFGEIIPAIRTSAGMANAEEEDIDGNIQRAEQMENIVSVQGNETIGQQIVITTRRRKSPDTESGEAVEEIFEDDCEVVDFADDRV